MRDDAPRLHNVICQKSQKRKILTYGTCISGRRCERVETSFLYETSTGNLHRFKSCVQCKENTFVKINTAAPIRQLHNSVASRLSLGERLFDVTLVTTPAICDVKRSSFTSNNGQVFGDLDFYLTLFLTKKVSQKKNVWD